MNEPDYAEALRLIRKHMQPGDTIGKMFMRVAKAMETEQMAKTTEELLEENNRLLAEQNRLLAEAVSASNASSTSQYMEEIRARARRNTPWGCKPPTWAR